MKDESDKKLVILLFGLVARRPKILAFNITQYIAECGIQMKYEKMGNFLFLLIGKKISKGTYKLVLLLRSFWIECNLNMIFIPYIICMMQRLQLQGNRYVCKLFLFVCRKQSNLSLVSVVSEL